MTEIKTSKLLSKLIEDSREIGNKRNPPFTAERFIVAIINKLNSSVGDRILILNCWFYPIQLKN